MLTEYFLVNVREILSETGSGVGRAVADLPDFVLQQHMAMVALLVLAVLFLLWSK